MYGGITGAPLLAKPKPLRDGAMSFGSKKEAKSQSVPATKREPVKKEPIKKEVAKEAFKEPEAADVGVSAPVRSHLTCSANPPL